MDYKSILLVLLYTAMILNLIIIAFIDMKEKIINQKLLWILLTGSAAAVYTSDELSLIDSYTAMAIMFLFLSLIYYLSRKGIGWGDVKLCTCIAPYLGLSRAFTMLFISILICGFIAVLLIAANRGNRNRSVPFAPFAAAGTIMVLWL